MWWFQRFVFHHTWGKWSNLANIFQMGWFNHHLVILLVAGWNPAITSWGNGSLSTIIYLWILYIPGSCLGILNHQQYVRIVLTYLQKEKNDISQPSPRFNQKHPKTQGLGYVIPLNIIKKQVDYHHFNPLNPKNPRPDGSTIVAMIPDTAESWTQWPPCRWWLLHTVLPGKNDGMFDENQWFGRCMDPTEIDPFGFLGL